MAPRNAYCKIITERNKFGFQLLHLRRDVSTLENLFPKGAVGCQFPEKIARIFEDSGCIMSTCMAHIGSPTCCML
jgi:hypothetical protein